VKPYSGYEFLGFVLPGLLVASVAYFGWNGWPHGEPGPVALLGITTLGYLSGHVVAALANWLEPLAWGRRPGSRPSSLDGLRGRNGKYANVTDQQLREWLDPDGEADLQRAFDLAYSRARATDLKKVLDLYNEQIGFYRNTATASMLALVIVAAYQFVPESAETLPLALAGPLLALAGVSFTVRYRRFWARFGDSVIRAARTGNPV
jgi:hypothetical protein